MPSEGKWEISLGDGKGGARDIELPAVSQATPKSKDFEGKNSGVGSPLILKAMLKTYQQIVMPEKVLMKGKHKP